MNSYKNVSTFDFHCTSKLMYENITNLIKCFCWNFEIIVLQKILQDMIKLLDFSKISLNLDELIGFVSSTKHFRCITYHRIRKVRATHIMLDGRTTIMAFIECTNLHTANTSSQQSCRLCMLVQNNSQSRLFK